MLTREHYEAERQHYLARALKARQHFLVYRCMGHLDEAQYHLGDLIEAHVRLVSARERYYGPRRTA